MTTKKVAITAVPPTRCLSKPTRSSVLLLGLVRCGVTLSLARESDSDGHDAEGDVRLVTISWGPLCRPVGGVRTTGFVEPAQNAQTKLGGHFVRYRC